MNKMSRPVWLSNSDYYSLGIRDASRVARYKRGCLFEFDI